MPSVERDVLIAASPERVWNILSDVGYMPKIFPDVVSTMVEPEGPVAVGQKIKILGKMAGMTTEMAAEVEQVEPNRKLIVRAIPGGPIKEYRNIVTLEPTKKGGTKVSAAAEYELTPNYLGKLVSKVVVSRIARRNATESLKNLKELAELKRGPDLKPLSEASPRAGTGSTAPRSS